MFRTGTKIPINFRKAIVRGIPLNREEIILQTIYNHKAITLKDLWNVIPKEEFGDELVSKNVLKTHYLHKMVEKEMLIRDKAEGSPFKKGGYAVNLRTAYKERLPYTLINLDPLPAFERIDYIFHLILYKDAQLPYEIFPENIHETIDKLNQDAIYFAEKLLDEEPDGFFSDELMRYLNRSQYNNKKGDPNLKYAKEKKMLLAESYKQKLEELPAFIIHNESNRIANESSLLRKYSTANI